MNTVNSKSDIKEGLKSGKRVFYTTNKKLLYGSALVAKFKSSSSLPVVGSTVSLTGGEIVIITLAILTTAIALYAIYMGYDVEVDLPNGKIKCRKIR